MKIALVAALAFTGVLAAQTAPAPGTGTIEGRVVNSATGAPVRKAAVALQSNQIRLSDATDGEGRFHFSALPAGTYKLTAQHAGFFPHAALRPISLGQDEHATSAEIRLPPHAAISGKVLDEDGDPVPGAVVGAYKLMYRDGRKQWMNPVYRPANDAGEYRIPELRPGRYIVQARSQLSVPDNQYRPPDSPERFRQVYVPAYYPNATSRQTAGSIDVAAGAEAQGIDVHLSKASTFHVTGRVTGVPAGDSPGANVALLNTDEAGVGFGGMSYVGPPDYRFEVRGTSGQYVLLASGADQAWFGKVSVSLTGDMQDVAIPVTPPPVVSGRVTLAERNAAVKVQDMIFELVDVSGNWRSGWASADASGKFVFTNHIPPGRYRIHSANNMPEGCFIQAIKVGGHEVQYLEFEVEGITQIEVVLSKTAATIAGAVSDGDGKPVADATATLIPADGSTPARAQADDGGAFQFQHLAPGAYTLYAWEELDDDAWQDPEFLKQYEGRAVKIKVGPSETQTAQLKVIPTDAK